MFSEEVSAWTPYEIPSSGSFPENFFVSLPDTLGDSTSLVESGIVDSTGVLEVVAFLEESFAIKIDDAELVPENLDSIGGMVALIARKRSAAA